MSPPPPPYFWNDRSFRFTQRGTLSPLLVSLCWMLTYSIVLSQNLPQGEDITTGTKPETLQYQPTRSKVPGMIRWMWDPKQTVPRIQEAVWLKDGSRMYARSEKQQHLLQIWEPVAVGPGAQPKLNLVGTVPLRDTWAVSPDGQWVFGELQGPHEKTMALFRGGSWEGMWEARGEILGHLEQAAFTRNGKLLILVTKLPKSIQIHAIDPASGRRIHRLERMLPEPASAQETSEIRVETTQETVLLPPVYRDDQTLSRWNPQDGQIASVSKSIDDSSHSKLCLSANERWLVLWGATGYRVLELDGGNYAERFGNSAEGSSIKNTQISPDSTAMVLSGGQQHQVIRLADRSVLAQSGTECLCGLFGKDGLTFWNTCRPLTPISTKTWRRGDMTQDPPKREIQQVEFSPDGRFLASRHARQIDLWLLEGMSLAPAAVLKGTRNSNLSTFVWDRNTNRVLGGDYCAFLQWKVPQSLDQKSMRVSVPATLLFDTAGTLAEEQGNSIAYASTQQLTASPATGDCYVSLNTNPDYTEVRHPDRPAEVRHLSMASKDEFPVSHVVFSPDGSELFYQGGRPAVYNQLLAYRLADSKLRISAKMPNADVVGFDSKHRRVILYSPDTSSGLLMVDANSLEITDHFLPPENCTWSTPVALSKDGRKFLCAFQDQNRSVAAYPTQFMLADIESGKILAVATHADPLVENCAFSADGTKIAFAHGNGNVSLWSVAEILEKCPAPNGLALQTPAQRQLRSQPIRPQETLRPQEPWQDGPLTEIRQPVIDGDVLKISAEGAVVNESNRTTIGQVLVNGTPMQVKGHRYRQIEGKSGTSYLHVQTELRSGDPKIRHHRELQIPANGMSTVCDAIDNLGSFPVTFDLSVVAALGGDATSLRDSANQPLSLQGTQLSLPDPVVLGSLLATGGLKRLTGLALATNSPEQKPRLTWDAARQAVLCTWTVHLEAFERCHLRYQFFQKHAKLADDLQRTLSQNTLQPWSAHYPVFHIRKLNMEDEKGAAIANLPYPTEPDGTQKDQRGYHWRPHGRTIDGIWCEVGAAQLLGLSFDGEPATYGTILKYEGGGRGAAPPEKLVECSGATGGMRSARRLRFDLATSSVQTVDLLYAAGDKPVTGQAELTVIASDKITKVLDAKGKRLDITKPVPATAHGNKFAVVFDDERESAVLVALADPDGTLQPTLNFAAGRGLFIRYETTLHPGDKVPLIHAATQRRLVDYPAIEEAFTSWESSALMVP